MTDKAEDVIDSLHEAEGLLGNECECMNHEDFCSWCSACKAVENARDLLASQAAEIAALKEREIMRLAGISTAAQGYFKDGESIHTDYDTVALRDVTALYRKYEALRAENAALREGLPVPPRNEYWAQGEYGHD